MLASIRGGKCTPAIGRRKPRARQPRSSDRLIMNQPPSDVQQRPGELGNVFQAAHQLDATSEVIEGALRASTPAPEEAKTVIDRRRAMAVAKLFGAFQPDTSLVASGVVCQQGPRQDDLSYHADMVVAQAFHQGEGALEVTDGLVNVFVHPGG
jgi:hypothetical protein